MNRDSVSSSDPEFRTTQWSLVISAGSRASPASDRALATLCQSYWLPLYAYARRRVADVDEARDLTQGFFVVLLEKNYLADADRSRGRFRAFLITAFKHFLANQWAKARTLKRGGGVSPLSLDFPAGDARIGQAVIDKLTPDQVFHRQWALTLLDQVIHRLEAEYRRSGKSELFEQLKDFLVGMPEEKSYADVAEGLGTTEAAAKMSAHRLRRRYRDLLRSEIAQTVANPEEIDGEIHSLFQLFQK